MAHTLTAVAGGGGTAVLVVLAFVVAAAVARPVIHAAIEVVHVVLIIAVVIVGVGAASLMGLLVWRWRRWQADAARTRPPCSRKLMRAAQPLPEPRPAIGPAEEQQELPGEHPAELHLHLHGVTAEDIAALLARQEPPRDQM